MPLGAKTLGHAAHPEVRINHVCVDILFLTDLKSQLLKKSLRRVGGHCVLLRLSASHNSGRRSIPRPQTTTHFPKLFRVDALSRS